MAEEEPRAWLLVAWPREFGASRPVAVVRQLRAGHSPAAEHLHWELVLRFYLFSLIALWILRAESLAIEQRPAVRFALPDLREAAPARLARAAPDPVHAGYLRLARDREFLAAEPGPSRPREVQSTLGKQNARGPPTMKIRLRRSKNRQGAGDHKELRGAE